MHRPLLDLFLDEAMEWLRRLFKTKPVFAGPGRVERRVEETLNPIWGLLLNFHHLDVPWIPGGFCHFHSGYWWYRHGALLDFSGATEKHLSRWRVELQKTLRRLFDLFALPFESPKTCLLKNSNSSPDREFQTLKRLSHYYQLRLGACLSQRARSWDSQKSPLDTPFWIQWSTRSLHAEDEDLLLDLVGGGHHPSTWSLRRRCEDALASHPSLYPALFLRQWLDEDGTRSVLHKRALIEALQSAVDSNNS